MKRRGRSYRQLVLDLTDLIRSRKLAGTALVVGITGIDTSGKSYLATSLAAELGRTGVWSQTIRGQ